MYSQRDPRWAGKKLGSSGLTVGQFGCLATVVIHQINRFLGTDYTPGHFVDWLNAHAGFTPGGALVWSKVAEFTRGKMRFVGSGLVAQLQKRCTIQQTAFGPIKHFVARLPGREVFEPWDGRKVTIVNNAISIEGRMRPLLTHLSNDLGRSNYRFLR